MARRGLPAYFIIMCRWTLAFAAPVIATLAIGFASATDVEQVPLYTGEDLDRMFGPPPPGPSVPVDKSNSGDWNTVERFLDRENARIDAERQHELNNREFNSSVAREDDSSRMYGSMLWGSGYYGGGYWNGDYGQGCGARDLYNRGSMAPYRAAYARASGDGYGRGQRGGLDRGNVMRGGGHRGGNNRGGSSHGGGRRAK